MKTKDLENFLRQFDPDSEVFFSISMYSEKKTFKPGMMTLGEARGEGVLTAPVIYLDSEGTTEMPEGMVHFWERKIEEAKAQK